MKVVGIVIEVVFWAWLVIAATISIVAVVDIIKEAWDGHRQGKRSDRGRSASATTTVYSPGWTHYQSVNAHRAAAGIGPLGSSRDGQGTDPRVEPKLVTSPVWGYRGWVVVDALELKLRSTNIDHAWGPGTNEAECMSFESRTDKQMSEFLGIERRAHPVPSSDCSCGFYARTEPDHIPGNVFGGVVGWGRVAPGQTGWRAQYAEIATLYLPAWSSEAMERKIRYLAEVYGVPLSFSLDEVKQRTSALAEHMAGTDLKEAL